MDRFIVMVRSAEMPGYRSKTRRRRDPIHKIGVVELHAAYIVKAKLLGEWRAEPKQIRETKGGIKTIVKVWPARLRLAIRRQICAGRRTLPQTQ